MVDAKIDFEEISIHAPREGSDEFALSVPVVAIISIHAPREGSDIFDGRQGAWLERFQSTLPARGATCDITTAIHAEGISIHAPREGSDGLVSISRRKNWIFQPTLPARGATESVVSPSAAKAISTHAPREGSDRTCLHAGYLHGPISTHAPREGSDDVFTRWIPTWTTFQPTLPARGATYRAVTKDHGQDISTHAPREGSDADTLKVIKDVLKISTHAPREGSDTTHNANYHNKEISTHAPREGSDLRKI